MSPILTLPAELLTHAFLFASYNDAKTFVTIPSVCKWFHQVQNDNIYAWKDYYIKNCAEDSRFPLRKLSKQPENIKSIKEEAINYRRNIREEFKSLLIEINSSLGPQTIFDYLTPKAENKELNDETSLLLLKSVSEIPSENINALIDELLKNDKKELLLKFITFLNPKTFDISVLFKFLSSGNADTRYFSFILISWLIQSGSDLTNALKVPGVLPFILTLFICPAIPSMKFDLLTKYGEDYKNKFGNLLLVVFNVFLSIFRNSPKVLNLECKNDNQEFIGFRLAKDINESTSELLKSFGIPVQSIITIEELKNIFRNYLKYVEISKEDLNAADEHGNKGLNVILLNNYQLPQLEEILREFQ